MGEAKIAPQAEVAPLQLSGKPWRTVMAILMTGALCAAGCQDPETEAAPPEEPGDRAWKLGALAQVGQARNRVEGHLYDETGRWKAPLRGFRVTADYRDPSGFEAAAEVSGLWTGTDTERWSSNGETLARERMSIDDNDISLLAGYGADATERVHCTLLGGGTFRRMTMDRGTSGSGYESLDADLVFATAEGRASLRLTEHESETRGVSVTTSLSASWLLNPKARVAGENIDGDQGWILRWRAGLEYVVARKTSLYLGGFMERMDLRGGNNGVAEWPDSQFTANGFECGLVVKF